MAQPKKRKARRRKGKIKFTSSARLVERNDNTRVARYPQAPTRLAADTGANFKIKIRRKR